MNLSERILTDTETRVLEKGLGFVPVTDLDPFKLHIELNNFFRSVRLKTFFKDLPSLPMTQGDSGLKPKSNFAPPLYSYACRVIGF